MPLSKKQQGVLRGMITASCLSGVLLIAGAALFPENWLPQDTGAALFAFAAANVLIAAVWLMVSIGTLARHRFVTPQDIDGSGLTSGSPAARVYQAILQNTLEQTVLASVAYSAFAAVAPVSFLGALPVAVLLFWIGRFTFWRGYANGAAHRAFGFALTFYSTVLLMLATALILLHSIVT